MANYGRGLGQGKQRAQNRDGRDGGGRGGGGGQGKLIGGRGVLGGELVGNEIHRAPK